MSEVPSASRELVEARDLRMCIRCGHKGADWHHRRTRAVADHHQHCPCNGILLCRTCHNWVHKHPVSARAEGLIVSRHCEAPYLVPAHMAFGWWLLKCDGDSAYVKASKVVIEDGAPWTPLDAGT